MTSDNNNTPPQHPASDGPIVPENPLPSSTPEKPRRQRRKRVKKPVTATTTEEGNASAEKPAESSSPKKPRRRPARKPKAAATDANKDVVEVQSGEVKPEAGDAPQQTDGEAVPKKRRLRPRRRGPRKPEDVNAVKTEVKKEVDSAAAAAQTASVEGEITEGEAPVKRLRQRRERKERPVREIPYDRRLFGRWECTECDHKWTSANAWRGKKQGCKLCGNMFEAKELRFLFHRKRVESAGEPTTTTTTSTEEATTANVQPSESVKTEEQHMGDVKVTDNNVVVAGEEGEQEPRLPHPSHLCEMCLSLGHSCRDQVVKKTDDVVAVEDDVVEVEMNAAAVKPTETKAEEKTNLENNNAQDEIATEAPSSVYRD